MWANFEINMTWPELVKRTAHETMSDDAQGLASQLAYYFFLALFPALLCFLAIASFFPLQHFTDDVIRLLGPVAPREILTLIKQQMVQIAKGNHGGLATVGLLGALWSSSAAMVACVSAMNKAYDIEESRPWWKVRLTAIALTVALSVFVTWSIVSSKYGKLLVAVRDAESRTRFIGYRVENYKLWVFTFSAIIAGIAGAL